MAYAKLRRKPDITCACVQLIHDIAWRSWLMCEALFAWQVQKRTASFRCLAQLVMLIVLADFKTIIGL